MRQSLMILWALLLAVNASANAASPDLMRAKKEAEAKGYIFETSRDVILEKAKREGQLRALISLDAATIAALSSAFRKRYPFLNVEVHEVAGREAGERFLLELRAGQAQHWDIARLSLETYTDYLSHAKKIDLLGMAEHGVLAIPVKMIDPNHRSVVATASIAASAAFNRCILEPSKAPARWEDFLKPEFKGRKFIVDVRPFNFAPMGAGAGEEWMVNYAKRLAAQQPVWLRGHARAMPAIAAGEFALHSLTNYQSVVEAKSKDPRGCLEARVIEPIPLRLAEAHMVLEGSSNPYAGLLWLEFMASPAAQQILDEKEPLKASIYSRDSALEKLTRGKNVWVLNWNYFEKGPKWVDMVVEAFGFPKAEKK